MSLKYAHLYKKDPKEEYIQQYIQEWKNTKGGRIAELPNDHPTIEVRRNIFMKQVEGLDLDIEHLVNEVDYKRAFHEWKLDYEFGDDMLEPFLEKIKSYEDPDPDQRDRDAKWACEKYKQTKDMKYFHEWLGHHQKLYIQALKNGKHVRQLQMSDALQEEFFKWCECPWLGDNYDLAMYLLNYPKGPSGYDNKPWAEAMMKCFYIGDNYWFDTADFYHQHNFVKDKDIALKPKAEMIQDLKNAQAKVYMASKASEVPKPVASEVPKPDVPEVPKPVASEPVAPDASKASKVPKASEPVASKPVASEVPKPVAPDPVASEPVASEVPKPVAPDPVAEISDESLEAELEKIEQKRALIKQKIAIRNQKKIMQELKPKYDNMFAKINKKRSFQNVSFEFGNLPPTEKAKKFKADIQKHIETVKELEHKAHEAREAAKKNIELSLHNLFN